MSDLECSIPFPLWFRSSLSGSGWRRAAHGLGVTELVTNISEPNLKQVDRDVIHSPSTSLILDLLQLFLGLNKILNRLNLCIYSQKIRFVKKGLGPIFGFQVSLDAYGPSSFLLLFLDATALVYHLLPHTDKHEKYRQHEYFISALGR